MTAKRTHAMSRSAASVLPGSAGGVGTAARTPPWAMRLAIVRPRRGTPGARPPAPDDQPPPPRGARGGRWARRRNPRRGGGVFLGPDAGGDPRPPPPRPWTPSHHTVDERAPP